MILRGNVTDHQRSRLRRSVPSAGEPRGRIAAGSTDA
jgi:hypothetical protein